MNQLNNQSSNGREGKEIFVNPYEYPKEREGNEWQVQVNGNKDDFEIALINPKSKGFFNVQFHWGWFDKNKMLIAKGGHHVDTMLGGNSIVPESVFKRLIKVAEETAEEMNMKQGYNSLPEVSEQKEKEL